MKNQKGITLIEVLATLAILSLVSTLIYGVFIGSQQNFKRISTKTSLSQEANLIVATIKNYHTKNNKYILSLDSSTQKASIGTTSANIPLHKDKLKILIKYDVTGTNTYSVLTGPKEIDSSKPLSLYIKITDQNGDFEEIETIIKRY
ncbi:MULTISPECIES: type II secretion system protein [unclassified Bacillus (in: firmicutes)]|uniref:type II secretion system protein n=1 Tax=unclassified Bacillus (in: firmicutes) TaxID=185979 RepID=UPI0008E7E543|nr:MULTISPECIES: type II secretion system protein [unclassified Bacillus (in: firmicutes)]SFB16370.1 prepilin-type N-terminal cleavage/methylation domain-containing protein [Bacillus sp. UNCCL13]SFQ78094.1 prepilin-type N-terminal cleavage/methylation domain-containing protein [Bacillus sp. cl95]